jgi:hypothetical protein
MPVIKYWQIFTVFLIFSRYDGSVTTVINNNDNDSGSSSSSVVVGYIPNGWGIWQDDSDHGEWLSGLWSDGKPTEYFSSRESR